MFQVADLADGGKAILENEPDFTRRELDMGILPFLSNQLAIGPSAPDDLAALSHPQLHIMDECSSGNISQRE
jgi:hypothetical protein